MSVAPAAHRGQQQVYCPSGCGSIFLKYTGKDILQHVDLFLASLASWPNPTSCPRCFLILVYELAGSCSPDCRTFNTVQLHRQEFWMSCIRLIVLLTEAHLPSLKQQLIANQRQCPRRALHSHGPPADMDVLDGFLDALYSAVMSGLTDGKRPLQPRGDDERFKYFHKRGGHWPATPEQLFPPPMGVERVVDALVYWCCAPVTSAHFALLTTFLNVARSLVVPRLLVSPTRDRLVWAIVQMLTPPGTTVPWPSAPPPFSPEPRASLRGNEHTVRAALSFLTLLRDDFNARADETTRFLAGFERPFLLALQSPVVAREPIAQDLIQLLRGGGGGGGGADVVLRIHEYLLRRKASRLCANPSCGASELQLTPSASPGNATKPTQRLFQQCANCRLARYCGRACQQQDWARGGHREACPILCRVLRAADPFLEADEFRRKFGECGLAEGEVGVLRRVALESGLLPQVRYA